MIASRQIYRLPANAYEFYRVEMGLEETLIG